MAASDRLSKLKKALEEKKKGASAKEKEAPEPKKQERAAVKPAEKASAKPERKPEPSPPRETKRAEAAPAPKPAPKPASKSVPSLPIKKPILPPKPDLNKRIIETILDDPRLSNHDQVMRVVIASIARKGEVDSKIKSIKDIVNEEIKKLLG